MDDVQDISNIFLHIVLSLFISSDVLLNTCEVWGGGHDMLGGRQCVKAMDCVKTGL